MEINFLFGLSVFCGVVSVICFVCWILEKITDIKKDIVRIKQWIKTNDNFERDLEIRNLKVKQNHLRQTFYNLALRYLDRVSKYKIAKSDYEHTIRSLKQEIEVLKININFLEKKGRKNGRTKN